MKNEAATRDIICQLLEKDYQQIVDMCADKQYGLPLPNRSIKHAGILTKAIFRNAEEKVEILSGSLNEVFLVDVKEDIKAALHAKSLLEVEIVLTHATGLNGVAQELKNVGGGRVRFFSATPAFKTSRHFTVSGNMYRLEESHADNQDFKNNPMVSAQANFNAPDGARFLHEQFEEAKGAELS